MRWLYKLPLRLRSLFKRGHVEQELSDELRFHLEKLTEDNVAKGMTPEEARYAALRELGGVDQIKEECRDMRRVNYIENSIHDLRFGLRMLARNPGFTAVAVLTLALGIAANVGIFSVVNSLLLRPLPVRNPSQLTVLATRIKGSSYLHDFSYADFHDCREQANGFSSMAGYQVDVRGFAAGGWVDRVIASFVTENFFWMLGVRPALGRLILPSAADRSAEAGVVVLGYSLWQRRFNGEPSVVGKKALLDGRPVTIIGVVPKEFRGVFSMAETDAYLPIGQMAGGDTSFWTARERRGDLRALARLKPGVSLAQARASLAVIAGRLAEQYPNTDKNLLIEAYPEWLARPQASAAEDWPPMVGLFLSLAFVLLLVACVNLANLLLVRANARQDEMAIRCALGAGQARMARQLLTENVLLAILGGSTGLLLSAWLTPMLARICTPQDMPFLHLDFHLDWRVFAYALGVTLSVGVLAGLILARRAWRSDPNVTLREGGRALSASASRLRLRSALVVVQVAGSTALLVIASLFVRSLETLRHMDLGFDPYHLLNLSMDMPEGGYDEGRGQKFYRELKERVLALPGVESATYAHSWPLCHYYHLAAIFVEGQRIRPGEAPPEIMYNVVDQDYFRTLRIPIQGGRAFTDGDNQVRQGTAIINQTMAELLWPGEDPVGKLFRTRKPTNPPLEVIGVARDSKYTPARDKQPYFYVPLAQNYDAIMTLQVRSALPPETLAPAVVTHFRVLAPTLPVFDVRTMDQALEGAGGFFLFHLGADLAGGFGFLGLLLAVIGVYGVVSCAASQRIHEIGIRLALGAAEWDILGMLLRQAARLVGLGVLMGVAVAFSAARAASGLIVGVRPSDPASYGGASLLLAAMALLASYLPARRATKVDPMAALHHE
jgi:putative ABC transport system permease protein